MKKKILSVCMATMMILGMAACGSSEQPTQQPDDEQQQTTAQENESTLDYDKIVVGLDDTFAPLGFRDEEGNLSGVDVELIEATSDIMGVPFELQPIDWSMKETELANKNIDMIWNGYTITEERKQKVAFSQPYLNNRQVVVTMADSDINTLADLTDKTVAAQAESSAIDAINAKPEIAQTFRSLGEFETNDQCLMDLEAGRTDAVVADEVIIRYYVSKKGEQNYKILEEDFGKEEYGIGVRKEDTQLLEALNVALDTLKENGTTKEISEKWFGSDIIME
ncbi:amino acid ABC transporter substrate-binding protein [Clostridium sp. MD294]|uniref:amino acid ABC transporter substrate-binding protein n=1 Tax=Clostridium sp. MD294 TaxID=97138 RepID=UPI0002C9A317|nr:amino acid ABC transporter substrate-binding protein [Clostridium sp. MD294]NDO46376.1 amino acid ABC transporter substrate-binding protein [Clostridium sp. MD294]USF29196.1 Glutamine-binding periplasmic protein [Clostridium sp. MD294]